MSRCSTASPASSAVAAISKCGTEGALCSPALAPAQRAVQRLRLRGRLLHLARETETATRHAADGQLGQLRIGAVTSAFFDPLPQMLAAFRLAHPRVEMVLQELYTHHAARGLADHAIEVALVRHLATPAWLEHHPLLEEEFMLALPTDWQLGEDEPTDLALAADASDASVLAVLASR